MSISYIGILNDLPDRLTVSIYFSGCDAEPKCTGCHNPSLWDPNSGVQITDDRLLQLIIDKLSVSGLDTVAFLGGEPLAQYNRDSVLYVSRALKSMSYRCVLFSYRTVEDIVRQNLLEYVKYIDEFKLGRYDYTLATGKFPASSNQEYMDRRRFDNYVAQISRRL